jgi:hypothetical protein
MAIAQMERDPMAAGQTAQDLTAIVPMAIVRTEAAQMAVAQMERDPMAIDRMEEGLMA